MVGTQFSVKEGSSYFCKFEMFLLALCVFGILILRCYEVAKHFRSLRFGWCQFFFISIVLGLGFMCMAFMVSIVLGASVGGA
jgi:branched-subunit amino acid transport protein AzlD